MLLFSLLLLPPRPRADQIRTPSAAAVPLDLPGKALPSSSRLRVASELASLQHRSAAHLPPTSATPHIPPVAGPKLSRERADTKGKARAAYASGQQGVLDHQREAAGGLAATSSPTTSLNSANSKSKPPVKAKASSKQKRREREKQQKAADFKEKLAVKDSGFEDRKVPALPLPLFPGCYLQMATDALSRPPCLQLKRDRAKRAWE